ncbi:MAG: hypothetical protein FJ034_02055 [Chloroflexi bacterium]|nr:hypothetical protein [Chloroflexota bacterium]
MTLFDFHIHSDRSPDSFVALAERARSMREVRPHAVSDHFPEWRARRDERPTLWTEDDVLRYVDEARALGLRVGLEYDLGRAPALKPSTRDGLDFMIGSIHQVFRGAEKLGYDAAGEFLKRGGAGRFTAEPAWADAETRRFVLERTLELFREGVERHRVSILGHPTMSPLAVIGDPDEGYPAEWQDRLIGLCVERGVAIEVNEKYGIPHRAFLARAMRAGARFAVGSDAHGPLGDLGRTRQMLAEAGIALDSVLR